MADDNLSPEAQGSDDLAAMETVADRLGDRPMVFRAAAIERAGVDIAARSVALAFSSESPVERMFGTEILDHGVESVDTGFIGSGRAPLLVDHNPADPVGVVEEVVVGPDRVARARVRFGRSARAEEVFSDVVDGIRSNVSVGYVINKMEKTGSENDRDVFRATSWTPLEISMVSIPADTSVGVGRAAPVVIQPQIEEDRMSDSDLTAVREEAAKAERARVSEIMAIAYRHNIREDGEKAVRDGLSPAEFRGLLFEKGVSKPIDTPAAELGMTGKEKSEYSLFRAVNAMLAGDRSKAGYEYELSQEIAARAGKQPRGLFVPGDIFVRDLTVGTSTAGGHLRPTEHLASSFVDALRARMVLGDLGARIMTGLKGNIAIPALNAKTAVSFVGEGSAPTEGAPTFRQITMTARSLSGFVDMSRLLLQNSDPSVEQIIRDDLIRQVASKIEDVAIEGGGSNEPTGITGTTGIGSVALGTNGDAPTWASIVQLVQEVETDDAPVVAPAFLINPKVKSKLARTAKVASTDSRMILDAPWNELYGYRMAVTTNVPSDLTKGSGSALSAAIFGEFSELMIGMWSGVDILVDPYTASSAGTVRLRTFQEVDVAVRHAESFAAILDMVTT